MKTKLSRALSSTAPFWTIQGLHPNGKWHDLYQYQDTVQGGLKAKAALNQLIVQDVPGVDHYEDFRMLEPVPEKVQKKARKIVLERRKADRGGQPPAEAPQARKRQHSGSGGRTRKGKTSA